VPADFHHCALITGASSGLGAEFAHQLGGRCAAMVLVARRGDRLRDLSHRLTSKHPGLQVLVVEADLVTAEGRHAVMAACDEAGLVPDLLINNAGMGDYGEFADSDPDKLLAMLRLNVEALTMVTHAVLPGMIAAGRGDIIQVSSLASLLAIPDFAVYAATKAYVTSFSEALRIELLDTGVHVTALCPGPVHTEFGSIAQRGEGKKESSFREWSYVDQEIVVADALTGVSKNQARVFPGLKIAAAAVVLGLLPVALLRLAMSTRPRR
jgi:hypothetical protein